MARSRTSGQGRPRGAQNLMTRQLRELILAALDDAGGQKYLAAQAKENPIAFMALLGRILPTAIQADVTAAVWTVRRNYPGGATAATAATPRARRYSQPREWSNATKRPNQS